MEEKKVKMSLGTAVCIFIIILLIVALGVTYYLGFIKNKQGEVVLKNEKTISKSEKTESISNDVDVSKTNTISIIDAVNYTEGYYNLFKVKLPKIVGNTDTIVELNQKILNEVLPKTYEDVIAHAEIPESYNKGTTVEYKYIIKNDVLVLYIYSVIPKDSVIPGRSGNPGIGVSYYYDVAKDKIITISEAANKLSLSLDGVYTKDGSQIKSYKELDYNGDLSYNIVIDNNNLKIESSL